MSFILDKTGTVNPDNDIRQEIDRAQAPFLRQGIRIQSNGGAKDFASYAEFTERNQSQRLLLAAEGERAAEYGLYYALISGHPSSCPLCVPWQGEVVINDVFAAGVPDGKTKLMSSAIDAGLFHFNCRHNYVVFIPGHDKPDIFRRNIASPEETAKRYAIEQQQRYNERNIRDWKMREAAAMTDVEKATSARKVEEWQSQQRALRDLAAKEGVPFYRQYSREQIGGDTKPSLPGFIKETGFTFKEGVSDSDLTFGAKNDIIKAENFDKLRDELKQKLNIIVSESAGGVDFKVLKEQAGGIIKMSEHFPEYKDAIYKISATKLPGNILAATTPTGEIKINSALSAAKYEQLAGRIGIAGTGAHEYTHAIEIAVTEKENPNLSLSEQQKIISSGKMATQVVNKAAKSMGYNKREGDMAALSISKYATRSDRELLAEAVGDVINNGEDAKPFSKSIFEQLKRRISK